jgi:hypothetical protein
MTTRRTFILAGLLIASVFSRADATSTGILTSSEYRAELDRLLAATSQLDSSGKPIPEPLHAVPYHWQVRAGQNEFDISTEGLQSDVRRYESERNVENAAAIRARLESLRAQIDGYEKPPADVSASRTQLTSILARREFRDVAGPSALDRFKQRLMEFLVRILQHFFRSTAIPTIGRVFVYGLMGVALLVLLYAAYRTFWRGQELVEVVPTGLAVSAKAWTLWLAEARVAAVKGEWRDAIHLAYWAGISFLEQQGFWKPDRARTPREYLRLLSGSDEKRETLAVLTRIFELAWYARRDASEGAFSEALAQLEKLGCQ